jgi:hypothetical protein
VVGLCAGRGSGGAGSPLAEDLPPEEGTPREAPPVLTGEGARQLAALMDNLGAEFQGLVRARACMPVLAPPCCLATSPAGLSPRRMHARESTSAAGAGQCAASMGCRNSIAPLEWGSSGSMHARL